MFDWPDYVTPSTEGIVDNQGNSGIMSDLEQLRCYFPVFKDHGQTDLSKFWDWCHVVLWVSDRLSKDGLSIIEDFSFIRR